MGKLFSLYRYVNEFMVTPPFMYIDIDTIKDICWKDGFITFTGNVDDNAPEYVKSTIEPARLYLDSRDMKRLAQELGVDYVQMKKDENKNYYDKVEEYEEKAAMLVATSDFVISSTT